MYSTTVSNTVLSSVVLCAITGLLFYVIHQKRKRNYEKVAQISKLIIYPVKSLPGIEVPECTLTKSGMKYGQFRDRSWMLVNSENRFITQRLEGCEILALLKPSFNENELWIDGPNMPTLKLQIIKEKSAKDTILQNKVWSDLIEGVYCGKEAEEWFSTYLKRPDTKLVQHLPRSSMRRSSAVINNNKVKMNKYSIIYHDGSGVLVINESSVNDLNTRLPDGKKVSFRNFRPNLLVKDCQPYGEDDWLYLNIRGIELNFLKPCDRCILTKVNPETGVRDATEPLNTLRTYRMADESLRKIYGNAPLFGTNFAPESEGPISCGDDISAVVRKE